MERKKGRLDLLEAIDFLDATAPKVKGEGPSFPPLSEATVSRGYPDDGTGVAGDDDRPPGNIVYGEKYKRTPYFNRLTDFQDSWEVDLGDWSWDEFENSMGMEDFENYSDTLRGMEDLFTPKQWNDTWKRMKNVPDDVTTKRFKQSGQPWRKGGEDQLGVEPEVYVDVDLDKGGRFKDADVKADKDAKNESSLVKKIDNITL